MIVTMQRVARVALAGLFAFAAPAFGQGATAYPTKPIRLIVGFAAGGPTDIQARVVAKKLSESLGQTILVDNRGGAGSMIGAEAAAKAPPDGYTLFFATISIVTAPALHAKPPIDPVKDFAPITMISTAPFLMVIHPSIPARTVKEYIALARTRPGQLSYATSGVGTPPHLVGELLKSTAGIDLVHVPHKGAAPAVTDLIAGQVSMSFLNTLNAVPLMQAGRLRALATTMGKRLSILPEVPTLAEAGVPGVEIGAWFAVVAPAGTSRDIIARMHKENLKALASPEVKQRLEVDGADPVGIGPEELAAYIRSEYAKWSKVVKQSGMRVE